MNPAGATQVGVVRPVSARSTILTLMIASDDVAALSDRDILAVTAAVGVSEPTARVALSRMVAAGDVSRHGSTFSLGERLLARRALQQQRLNPAVLDWQGEWELAVVMKTGRSAAQRAALREQLTLLRLAELREGVWMRPANLEQPWPDPVTDDVRRLPVGQVDDAADLVHKLWDLNLWHAEGHALLDAIASAENPAARFAACVASVRHLMTDPTLPEQLRANDWPADELRATYDEYRSWLFSFRTETRLTGRS